MEVDSFQHIVVQQAEPPRPNSVGVHSYPRSVINSEFPKKFPPVIPRFDGRLVDSKRLRDTPEVQHDSMSIPALPGSQYEDQ